MAQRHYKEFYSLPVAGVTGERWRVELWDANFSGTATEVDGNFEGFTLDWQGDDTDPYTPLMGSSAAFTMLIDAANQSIISELANAAEGRFHLVIKRGASLPVFWLGYVVQDNSDYADQYFPYELGILAVDGFARLKDLDYVNPSTGVAYLHSLKDTWLQHLYKIIDSIGLTDLTTLPTIRLRSNCNWFEDTMSTSSDPLTQAKIKHERFRELDEQGRENIWNCYDVLEALCRSFGARFFFANGAYHFFQVGEYENATQKIYNYDSAGALVSTDSAANFDLTVDYSTATGMRKRAGGQYSFLQPLKKVVVDYHHYKTFENRGVGLSWDKSDEETHTLPGIYVDVDYETQLRIIVNFKHKTQVSVNPSAPFPTHRYKWTLKVKIGTLYLDRVTNGFQFFDLQPGDLSWSTDSSKRVEIWSQPVAESLNNVEQSFQFALTTPTMFVGQSEQDIDVLLKFENLIKTDGAALVFNGSPYEGSDVYETTSFWLSAIKEGLGNNPDSNTLRHVATDSGDNTGILNVDTYLGDGPAPFSVSNILIGASNVFSDAWRTGTMGTTYPINTLLAREMLALRKKALKIYRGAVLEKGMNPFARIVNASEAYMPLRLRLNAFSNIWEGDFALIGRVYTITNDDPVEVPNTGPSTPGGSTPVPISDPLTPVVQTTHPGFSTYNLAEAIAGTILSGDTQASVVNGFTPNKLTVVASNLAFAKVGDKVKIVNPANGKSQLLTVAADYVPGSTELRVTEDLTADYPGGSVVLHALRYNAANAAGFAEQFANVTALFVTVTAGTLPDPAVVSTAEIVRRVKVWRGGGAGLRAFYGVTGGFTITYATNRITFDEKLREETVLVEVI